MTRPNGLIAKEGLELLTFATPSGKMYLIYNLNVKADLRARVQDLDYA